MCGGKEGHSRTIVQTADYQLLTTKDRVQSRDLQCAICGRKK